MTRFFWALIYLGADHSVVWMGATKLSQDWMIPPITCFRLICVTAGREVRPWNVEILSSTYQWQFVHGLRNLLSTCSAQNKLPKSGLHRSLCMHNWDLRLHVVKVAYDSHDLYIVDSYVVLLGPCRLWDWGLIHFRRHLVLHLNPIVSNRWVDECYVGCCSGGK